MILFDQRLLPRSGVSVHRSVTAATGKLLPLLLVGVVMSLPALAQLPPGTTDASSSSRTDPAAQQEDPVRTQASQALDRHDFPTALKLLATLAERYPADAHVLFDLASAQDALDQETTAEASYRRAIASDPAYLEPHLALGLLLARGGHAAEARTELQAATTLKTSDPALKARALRALAHLDRSSNPAEARDALLAALKLTPETTDDTLLSADLAEQAQDHAAAESAYHHLLALNPNEPAATAALAHLLLARDRATEAEPLLSSALAAHPGDPALSAELAVLYLHANRREEAMVLVDKLHTGEPGNAAVNRLYAHLLSQAGQYERSEPIFAALSAETPDDASLIDDRADALIHLKRYAEAQALLQRAVDRPSSFANKEDLAGAAGHLAFAASQNNDPAATLRAIDLRTTILPQSPPSLFLAAAAHDRLHHLKQASQMYRQFLSVANGKFPDEEWEARHRLIALDHMK